MLFHNSKSDLGRLSLTGDERQLTSNTSTVKTQQLAASHIMQLQRTVGNKAVAQMLQTKAASDRGQNKENAKGLNNQLKSGLEQLSGVDLSDVLVHRNSNKPQEIGALAYAQGTDIHLGPGQEKHLPHEGWHVVQQKRGQVQATKQLKNGMDLNDDSELEREADQMGEKALALGASETLPPPASEDNGSPVMPTSGSGVNGVVQGVIQRTISHDAPNFQPNNGRAGKVSVTNIKGRSLGESANAPSVDVFGWQELLNDGHTLGNTNANSSHYNAVRMHLWNGRLDGPGNNPYNLAPGPATTNSSMSAGPERAAKEAVDEGKSIWLETEVFYQNDNVQKNDFTSVIPNRMKMDWGYMTNGRKGPNRSDWDEIIDQPAGSLTAKQQGEYKGLTNTTDLDNKLNAASKQEMAQAYGLVIPALQKHMLLKYDVIYFGMQDSDREIALTTLNKDEIIELIQLLDFSNDHIAIHSYVLSNLYNDTNLLQNVFGEFDANLKKKILEYVGEELIEALDDVGQELAKTERYVFSLLSFNKKYVLLESMSASQIDSLFNNKSPNSIFMDWARTRRCRTVQQITDFIEPRISYKFFKSLKARELRFFSGKPY